MLDVPTGPAMTCQFTRKQPVKGLLLKLILHSRYPFLLLANILPNIMFNFVVCLGHGVVVKYTFLYECLLLGLSQEEEGAEILKLLARLLPEMYSTRSNYCY